MALRVFDPTAPRGLPVRSAVMDLVEGVARKVSEGKLSEADAAGFLRRALHGPIIEFAVRLTPTPLDDLALEFARTLFPAA